MEHIEKSTKKLELVNQWIANCDTKSSFILTFYGVVLTIIFTSNIGGELINSFSFTKAKDINCENFKNLIILLSSIAFFVTSIITFYQIYLTLKGRIDPNVYHQSGLNINSNIFFGSIASKNFIDFENETNSEDIPKYLNDLNSQIFINSKIVNLKFKHYNNSLMWMFISLGIFIVFVVIK